MADRYVAVLADALRLKKIGAKGASSASKPWLRRHEPSHSQHTKSLVWAPTSSSGSMSVAVHNVLGRSHGVVHHRCIRGTKDNDDLVFFLVSNGNQLP